MPNTVQVLRESSKTHYAKITVANKQYKVIYNGYYPAITTTSNVEIELHDNIEIR